MRSRAQPRRLNVVIAGLPGARRAEAIALCPGAEDGSPTEEPRAAVDLLAQILMARFGWGEAVSARKRRDAGWTATRGAAAAAAVVAERRCPVSSRSAATSTALRRRPQGRLDDPKRLSSPASSAAASISSLSSLTQNARGAPISCTPLRPDQRRGFVEFTLRGQLEAALRRSTVRRSCEPVSPRPLVFDSRRPVAHAHEAARRQRAQKPERSALYDDLRSSRTARRCRTSRTSPARQSVGRARPVTRPLPEYPVEPGHRRSHSDAYAPPRAAEANRRSSVTPGRTRHRRRDGRSSSARARARAAGSSCASIERSVSSGVAVDARSRRAVAPTFARAGPVRSPHHQVCGIAGDEHLRPRMRFELTPSAESTHWASARARAQA